MSNVVIVCHTLYGFLPTSHHSCPFLGPSAVLGERRGYTDPSVRRPMVSAGTSARRIPSRLPTGAIITSSHVAPRTVPNPVPNRRIRDPAQLTNALRLLPPTQSRVIPPSARLQPPLTAQNSSGPALLNGPPLVNGPRRSMLHGSQYIRSTSPRPAQFSQEMMESQWRQSEALPQNDTAGFVQPMTQNAVVIRSPPPPFAAKRYVNGGDRAQGIDASFGHLQQYPESGEYDPAFGSLLCEESQTPRYYQENSFEVKWGGARLSKPRQSDPRSHVQNVSWDAYPYQRSIQPSNIPHEVGLGLMVKDQGIERFKKRKMNVESAEPPRNEFEFVGNAFASDPVSVTTGSFSLDGTNEQRSPIEDTPLAGAMFDSQCGKSQRDSFTSFPTDSFLHSSAEKIEESNQYTVSNTGFAGGDRLFGSFENPLDASESSRPFACGTGTNVAPIYSNDVLNDGFATVGSKCSAGGFARFRRPPVQQGTKEATEDPLNRAQGHLSPEALEGQGGATKTLPKKDSCEADPTPVTCDEKGLVEPLGERPEGKVAVQAVATENKNAANAVVIQGSKCINAEEAGEKKRESDESQETVFHPKERHPSFDAPEWIRFYKDGKEVDLRGKPVASFSPKTSLSSKSTPASVSPKTKELVKIFATPSQDSSAHHQTRNPERTKQLQTRTANKKGCRGKDEGDSVVDDFESLSDADFANATSLWGL